MNENAQHADLQLRYTARGSCIKRRCLLRHLRRSATHLFALLPIALWTVYCGPAQSKETVTDQPGIKRALLIGINQYKAVPKLQGSLNDVQTMRQILLTRWGFDAKYITLLTDEAATRAGILAALEQLAKEAAPNDTLYVHYSGHGSQVEDLNGDEPEDRLDETIVPQDGRTDGVRDITDDELDMIFSRMPAKTALIVLDSCHSGTATRSLDIRTRSIPRDYRIDIYRQAEATEPKTRAVVPVITARYVVMTGAASHQEALDGPVHGRYHGFFTYSLSKSLGGASPDVSPREVLTGVERELKRIQMHYGRSSMPEPQLEAPPDLLDKALFTVADATVGATSARLPWLEVAPRKRGVVTLINGQLLGAGVGSKWSLYPPGDTQFVPGRAVAVATVIDIAGKDSVAKVHSSTDSIPAGARAVALLPAPTGQRIPIRLLDMPPDRRAVVEQTLRTNIKDVDLVGPQQAARFSVDVEGGMLRLLASDGLQVVGTFPLSDAWGVGLATVLSRSAKASELLTIDNPSSQLRIDARVSAAERMKPTVTARGVKLIADTQAVKYRIRNPDKPRTEQNSLQLELRVNSDAYLTIIDVDSEGGINLLFPNSYQRAGFRRDGFIRANESVLIPDSLNPGNEAGFYWDYSPPIGTDTIRIFASTDMQTAHMIRERIKTLVASGEQDKAVKSRSLVETIQWLRDALASVAARGIVTVNDTTSHVPGNISSSEPMSPNSLPSPVAEPAMTISSSAPLADWTATSLIIVVSE